MTPFSNVLDLFHFHTAAIQGTRVTRVYQKYSWSSQTRPLKLKSISSTAALTQV